MNEGVDRSTEVFESALEDLIDDAYRLKGKLHREDVDRLYMARAIEPDQAVAIERALAKAGVEIVEPQLAPEPSEPTPSGSSSLSATATKFLASVARRYKLLTSQEELECGEAIQEALRLSASGAALDSPLAKRVFERAETARVKLATRNIRLVLKMAFDRRGRSNLDVDDLVQFGLMGLLRATEKFDPEWECRFTTYATWWIRQAISRGVADTEHTIRIPVHMREKINKYRRTRRRLGFDNRYSGEQIRPIAEKLAWTEEYTARIAQLSEQSVVSIDAPVAEGTDLALSDLLPDDAPRPDQIAATKDMARRVRQIIHDLNDSRLQDIVSRRFGFYGPPETLEQIGQDYGLTRERIRQLEAKAIKRLRYKARSAHLNDGFENRRSSSDN